MTTNKMVQIYRFFGETCCSHFQSIKVNHAAKIKVIYSEREKWPDPESDQWEAATSKR
jgi:hypothetical protein